MLANKSITQGFLLVMHEVIIQLIDDHFFISKDANNTILIDFTFSYYQSCDCHQFQFYTFTCLFFLGGGSEILYNYQQFIPPPPQPTPSLQLLTHRPKGIFLMAFVITNRSQTVAIPCIVDGKCLQNLSRHLCKQRNTQEKYLVVLRRIQAFFYIEQKFHESLH